MTENESAVENLKMIRKQYNRYCITHAIDIAINAIENQKTGEWIEDYQEDALPYNKRGWICSNCDSRTSYGTPPFCMRCGAKMEVKHE